MSQPNIILFVSDQHRSDWMGAAGNPFVKTPNMDMMAKEGVNFSNTYCNSPLCVPSRMSMVTGRHPHKIGVTSNGHTLPSDIPTFAHAMGLGGYETVLCGRMHFTGPDQRHGFEKRLVGDITPTYPGGPKTEYGELEGTASRGMKSIELSGPGDSPVLQFDRDVVKGCEQFIAQRNQNAQEDRPLFMTVGTYGPHTPYVSPPVLYEEAYAAMEGIDTPIPKDKEPLHPWMAEWFKQVKMGNVSDEQVKRVRAAYAGMIGHIDRLLGDVLEAAKSLPGDTYVIYLSDHGEMAGDRGMYWKFSFYEGAVKVPMLWYAVSQKNTDWKLAQNRTVDVPVSLLDLAPTFAGIANAPEMPKLDGNNLLPLLDAANGDAADLSWDQRSVFSELTQFNDVSRMMVKGRYKLVYHHSFPKAQLFDLVSDPQEQNDLGENADYQYVKDEMIVELMKGWDPEEVKNNHKRKTENNTYLGKWGKVSGWGRHELWNPGDSSPR